MLFTKLKDIKDNLNSTPLHKWILGITLIAIIIGLFFIFNGPQAFSLNAGMVSLSQELWGNPGFLNTEAILSGYLDRNPEDMDVWEGLGSYRFIRGEYEQASETWQQAGLTAWDLIQKGEYLRRNGQFEDAKNWYAAAVDIDPGSGDGSYFLGWMYVLDGNMDLAWRYLTQADGLPLYQVSYSDLYYQMGKVVNAIGPSERSISALDYFSKAILDDHFTYPFQAVDAHFQRALIYRQNGWNDMAIDELNYVVSEYPTHYSAWVRLGYMAWEVEKDLTKAESYFSQAFIVDDQQLPAYFGLALALREAGEDARAVQIYKKILELDPKSQAANDALRQIEE